MAAFGKAIGLGRDWGGLHNGSLVLMGFVNLTNQRVEGITPVRCASAASTSGSLCRARNVAVSNRVPLGFVYFCDYPVPPGGRVIWATGATHSKQLPRLQSHRGVSNETLDRSGDETAAGELGPFVG